MKETRPSGNSHPGTTPEPLPETRAASSQRVKRAKGKPIGLN